MQPACETRTSSIINALMAKAEIAKKQHIRDYFSLAPDRASSFIVEAPYLTLDYARQRLLPETLQLLLELARSVQLEEAIQRLFNKYQLHPALRAQHTTVEIEKERDRFLNFAEELRLGKLGVTSQKITDWIHIGIGGSHVGSELVTAALKPYHKSVVNVHFVANIDEEVLFPLLSSLDPQRTMVCIASKSFRTLEPLQNARSASCWLEQALGARWKEHMIAVTEQVVEAVHFGILPENVFPIGKGVGGRFSVWSAIGFPIALTAGKEAFLALLKGAEELDHHFQQAPLAFNMPVLLALLNIWNHYFMGAQVQAVLPYSHLLRYLPTYLQQLEMESNGKQPRGFFQKYLSQVTCPVIFGQEGCNGQHSFYQLLHQGGLFIPADFILICHQNDRYSERHRRILWMDALSQVHTLSFGTNHLDQKDPEYCEGNQPCNVLLLSSLTPEALGALLALYEHKVYSVAAVLGINPFDQPGVEQGKRLAAQWLFGLEHASQSFPMEMVALVERMLVVDTEETIRQD